MNSQTKKLVAAVAIVGIVLVAGTFTWINQIRQSAELQVRESMSHDESVRGRVFGFVSPFQLIDRSGAEFESEQLEGTIWIANLIRKADPERCRRQAAEFRELCGDVELVSPGGKLMMVSVMVDRKYDTPEKLAKFASDAGIDEENTKLLLGTSDDVWALGNEGFEIAASRADDATLAASSECYLVDHYRRVRGKYDMLDELDALQLKHDVEIVESEKTPFPEGLLSSAWMKDKQASQLATVDQFDVPYDFQFRDMRPESGIQFRNKVVDDAARTYVASHYDHGNGVIVADVDGDGMLDIYFVTQAGGNELWRNLGNGQFENITDSAGVAVENRIGVTASFADTDNDGDADLFVTTVRGGNLMFENDGKGQFTDITKASGLGYVGHSSSAVFFDYNRDGLVDLFLTNVGKYTLEEVKTVTMEQIRHDKPALYQYYAAHPDAFGGHLKQDDRGESSILYENLGDNKFADVSEKTKLVDETWSGAATPVDFNNDGWLDLYVLNMQGHDSYYINVEGKHFQRKSREVFPMTPWGSMGVKVFDVENDGDMDLFLTDMHSDMSQEVEPDEEKLKADCQWTESFTQSGGKSIWGNALFRNDGNESFVEVSDEMGAENFWPWGLSVGDLNADGYEDVFITASMNFPFRYSVNTLLLNNRGKKFLDSEFLVGVEPRRDGKFAEPCFELDSVADKEIPIAKGRIGRIAVWSSLGSRSSVMFDLDDDGDLDIVTNENNSWPMVLVSDLSERNKDLRFLKVNLVGTKSNRDGLGAVVRVVTESQTYMKANDGQSGYMSQSRCPLYFGLGDIDEVRSIEVTWPSGVTQSVEGPIKPNQTVEITEESD